MPIHPIPSLPAGEEVLVDANVFVYGLNVQSVQCRDFLRRCASGEISAFATVDILSDVCHRLMLAEAAGLGHDNATERVVASGKPHVVRQLQDYWNRIQNVMSGAIAILPLDEFRFRRAHAVRRQHGLMTADSLVLAAADVFGIGSLATNDDDFDAVPWIDVDKPTDLALAVP
jgi:predicted nucleic acid-binding protein